MVGLSSVRLGIACPMANEAENAVSFVQDVLRVCHEAGCREVAFFAVLDKVSKDETLELLQELARTVPELTVVFAPENRCVVDAYVRAYREALNGGCDWILEIDAGYSHQPADIPLFLQRMREGYDCVFGTRFGAGGRLMEGTLKRRLISRGGTLLANLFLGTRLSDMTSGFELFSRRALTQILEKRLFSRGPFFQTEIKAYAHGYRIAEVPIHYRAPSHVIRGGAILDSFGGLWKLFSMRLAGRLYATGAMRI